MGPSPIKIQVGCIVVSLEGSGEVYERILERTSAFERLCPMSDADIAYQLLLREQFEKRAQDFDFRFRTKFFDIGIKGRPLVIAFSCRLPFKESVIRFLPEYLHWVLYGIGIKRPYSLSELRAEAFICEVFEWSSHFVMLKKGASYVYASAVEDLNDEKAYIFVGRSGSGKTTIAAHLSLCEDHFRSLSDDRLIIDKRGRAYFNEGRSLLRIRALLSPDELRWEISRNQTLSERILWKFLGMVNKDTAKWVSLPTNSDDAQSATGTPIKYCFFLRPSKAAKKISLHKIKADDLARRTSRYMFLRHGSQFRYVERSGHGDDFERVREEIESIHRAAFSGAECYELCVPVPVVASDLQETVKGLIGGRRRRGDS